MEKTCNTCRKTLPVNEDYFYWYAITKRYDDKCINCYMGKRKIITPTPILAPIEMKPIPIPVPIEIESIPVMIEPTPIPVPKVQPIKRTKPRKTYTKIIPTNPIDEYFLPRYRRLYDKHKKRFASEVISFNGLIDIYTQTQGKCYYTGLEYSLTERGPLYLTIDRIDSTCGYTQENICFCCWFVNCAKNMWTLETLVPLWAHLPKQIN